jgi:hypothetical protein
VLNFNESQIREVKAAGALEEPPARKAAS